MLHREAKPTDARSQHSHKKTVRPRVDKLTRMISLQHFRRCNAAEKRSVIIQTFIESRLIKDAACKYQTLGPGWKSC